METERPFSILGKLAHWESPSASSIVFAVAAGAVDFGRFVAVGASPGPLLLLLPLLLWLLLLLFRTMVFLVLKVVVLLAAVGSPPAWERQ